MRLYHRHSINNEITHLAEQSDLLPFCGHIVPVDLVEKSADDRMRLNYTRDYLNKMGLFEFEEYIRTRLPGHLGFFSKKFNASSHFGFTVACPTDHLGSG